MESARKRKAANAMDGNPTKRLKLLNSNHPSAAKPSVQDIGRRLVEHLHRASDKTGRAIATQFLTLPPKDDLPDYYDITKLPIAIDTIEKKLLRNAYPTLTTLESDLKRMVQNAKDYNAPKSDVYEDAERIRKLVYNYMKIHNPAYEQDPNYTSFPTPIPEPGVGPAADDGHADQDVEDGVQPSDSRERPVRSVGPQLSEPPSERKVSVAPSGTTGDDDPGGEDAEDEDADTGGNASGDVDFTDKTFQEAQKMIIAELLRYSDDEGLEIYTPFGNLPSRKLEDYYKVIKRPVCLKGVAKRIRGQHGRNPPTGISDFKTWAEFEEEVSCIWRNAQHYNEDGSDMFILAEDLKKHFSSLLGEAKEKVDQPSGPRIKLGGPKPKVTINLSQHRDSPTPGVTVDSEALARQRKMVQAGVNGQQQAPEPVPLFNGLPRAGSHASTIEPARPQSSAPSGSPPVGPVKDEKMATQSPVPSNGLPIAQPLTNGMMPPSTIRPPSNGMLPPQSLVNGYTYTPPLLLPPTTLRSYPAEQALLPSVTVATHPQLKVTKPLSISVPPHESLSHQSTTITLPSSHYFLQIAPTIAKQLSMGRPYKLFVTVNGTRLNQRDTIFHSDSGKRTHVYEGSLAQGVNRIEVEVAASKQDADTKGLDIEKVTIYANLMR